MSQWAREFPERYEEIAKLPLREQNAALREAMGYDPDYIRDGQKQAGHVLGDRPTTSPRGDAGSLSSSGSGSSPGARTCDACGAPEGALHAHYCDLRGRV